MKKIRKYLIKKIKKNFWGVSIIIFLGLIVLFFHGEGEGLNIRQRINSEKISHFFSIIGTFVTSFTVYLLYRQVNEMIVGRNLAYQPILYINKNEFLTEDNSNYDYTKTMNGKVQTVNAQFYKLYPCGDVELVPRPTVSVKNIGLGVARNIEIQWMYDSEEVKSYIKDSYDENDLSFEYEENIDFISVNESTDVYLPYAYMQLYGTKLNQDTVELADKGEKENDKPSICLKITYKNIYGKKYMSSFGVNIKAVENKIKISFKETINKSSPKN